MHVLVLCLADRIQRLKFLCQAAKGFERECAEIEERQKQRQPMHKEEPDLEEEDRVLSAGLRHLQVRRYWPHPACVACCNTGDVHLSSAVSCCLLFLCV